MARIIRAMTRDGSARAILMDGRDIVERARQIHNTTPVATAALGRTLTVCTFMSSNLKNQNDKLSVTVAGDGAGGKITVCGNGELAMRGYIDNPQVELPLRKDGKLDVG
ncbi:MAG: Hsp33 family molecular chaperone HslO, partial [Clostridia bacterium]|nr:Hsp33 family molecular chaperone HslO [Clostridia bacterium]